MKQYLACTDVIDWEHPSVTAKAADLARGCITDVAVARSCFEFVRDSIKHSWDFRTNPVTCKASEVLIHGTGYCYAKSHLLAGLLRANGIPAGLCYQRLRIDPGAAECCLHGLNAAHLKGFGWYRMDARGNKPGVSAEFCPPVERLAFPIEAPTERDFPEIWPEPLPIIVKMLTECDSVEQVANHLPDVEVLGRTE